MTPDTPPISEAKRALLDKVMRGDLPKSALPVEHVAAPTQARPAARGERVVALHTRGSNPPFFFLHGQWLGDGYFSYPLAHDLGPDQPFYAIEPYTFEGARVAPTLEAVAAAHVRAIRRIHPTGPYLLGGYCNGALIAYEVARQLECQGETVCLVAMVDPMPPPQPALALWAGRRPADLARYRSDLVFVGAVIAGLVAPIGRLLRLNEEKRLNVYLRLIHGYRLLRAAYNWAHDLRHAPGDERDEPQPTTMTSERHAARFPTPDDLRSDYEGVLMWVASTYHPGGISGKVALLWSREADPGQPYWRAVWQRLLASKAQDDVEHITVPGTHRSLRYANIHSLAAHICGRIQWALASRATP